jgi:prevent-host-death family protein
MEGSMAWPVQDAKQKFSSLVEAARADGPQVVTRHGREVAVVLSVEDYRALGGGSVKDALRAFGEAVDDGFLEILEEVVAENRRDVPREITLER